MGKYLWSLIATVFQKWDFSRLGALQAVTYTLKVVESKKWLEIDTLLLHTINRKYHMAYLFLPFPVTSDDLEGHSPNAGLIKCNSTNICATFSTVLTVTACGPSAIAELLVDEADGILCTKSATGHVCCYGSIINENINIHHFVVIPCNSGVWVGECFFWYRPTRVVRDQRPLIGRCCCCSLQLYIYINF